MSATVRTSKGLVAGVDEYETPAFNGLPYAGATGWPSAPGHRDHPVERGHVLEHVTQLPKRVDKLGAACSEPDEERGHDVEEGQDDRPGPSLPT